MKDTCTDKPLCVVSILPHILDCDAACRNAYLNILTAMGEKYKKKMWGYVCLLSRNISFITYITDILK